MLYKEDWERAKEMYRAWWEGEKTPRPLLYLTSPLKKPRFPVPEPPEPKDLEDRWTNPEIVLGNAEKAFASTYFAAEGYPNMHVNLGPGIAATYMGSTPTFMPETVWFGRNESKGWDEILGIDFDPNNKWWIKTKELTMAAVERGKGRYIIGITDLGGILDILASLRGTEQLLVDLIENPKEVVMASERIIDIWHRCYDELYGICLMAQEGSSAWMGLWSPGRWYPIQCDFSAMISPSMFEEFVIPHIEEQCRRLDHIIYHWDGPGQIPHLELLLKVDGLHGIQWTPGAGNPGLGYEGWFPYYRRILDSGKRLVLLGMDPKEVIDFLKVFGGEGCFISTWASSPEEADAFVMEVERLCTA
jgi:5-methyltetrahydrofolate--homocysteine methyltransferase